MGDPDAPATVGPTGGPDPEPTVEATYEPTSFPYESMLDLSEEEQAEIEDLLLLIDEFTHHSSGISQNHQSGINKLETQLSREILEKYDDFIDFHESNGYDIVGSVDVIGAEVSEYDQESAVVFACYYYDRWGPVEADTGEPAEDGRADLEERWMAGFSADHGNHMWVLSDFWYTGENCD